MIAGLPWTAWVLLLAAVGFGLIVILRFYWINRPDRNSESNQSGGTN